MAVGGDKLIRESDALAAGIRRGSQQCYELFYRMEFDNLVHFINGYLHDFPRACDIAQETFCAVWENRESIDESRNFRALVFTSARNRTINALREKKVFANPANVSSLDNSIMMLEDSSLDSLIDSLDLLSLVRATWSSLPARAKLVFGMSRLNGMRNKRIAEVLGVSVKTVEYHMKTALDSFRNLKKNY